MVGRRLYTAICYPIRSDICNMFRLIADYIPTGPAKRGKKVFNWPSLMHSCLCSKIIILPEGHLGPEILVREMRILPEILAREMRILVATISLDTFISRSGHAVYRIIESIAPCVSKNSDLLHSLALTRSGAKIVSSLRFLFLPTTHPLWVSFTGT